MKNFTKKLLLLIICSMPLALCCLAQTYTFTNATATGENGPTQAQVTAAYATTNLAGTVTSTAGIQTWTVPVSGLYKIEATGAKGHGALSGRGAYMSGFFTLTAGTQLKILVGQEGGCCVASGTEQYGGGGGSFVATSTNTPLIVAGGGGGANGNTTILPNSDASITTAGNDGAGSGNGLGGTNGGGGAGINNAGGGGGFSGDGGVTAGVPGGFSFINGGVGGSAGTTSGGRGGFGGGGGANSWNNRRGGGGGGYSGGGGAGSSTNAAEVGGGGGSFNSGIAQVNIPALGTGHGLVVITKSDPIPNNASASAIVSPAPFICPGIQNIEATIANLGSNTIDSVRVFWEVNGVVQGDAWQQVNLSPITGTTFQTNVSLGTFNFPAGTHDLRIWTSLPNNQIDTSNSNDTISITVSTQMSGNYTINSALPTGGSNYQNFTDFVNDLNTIGICGPVVADVNPTSGPYNDLLYFGNINGSSPVNTIRINGNGRTVQYNNDITDRQLIRLMGTKHLRIDSLNFVSLNATYGWAAIINSGAAYDSITRCNFDLSATTSTASASTSGICFSGSLTSALTAGANATNCYIAGNTLQGPTTNNGYYYALTLMGGADSNIVENNNFFDYYFYGIYASGSKFNKINNNELARPTKTAVTTFYGIYTTGAIEGTEMVANRIHSPGGTVSNATNTAYGIYYLGSATAAAPVTVANNLIYNMNSGGTSYGLYLSSATNTKVMHNTIVYDQIQTGTSTQAGMWILGTNTGLEIKNNNISITGGNLGTKYGINYTTAASLTSIADAQRNNIYVNSTQTGNQWYAANPTATTYANLAAFQAANPTLEIGSPSTDPLFAAPLSGDFTPMAGPLIGGGQNVLADVPNDINGIPRSAAPTIGAFEIMPTGNNDASAMSIVNPNGNICATSVPVEAVIRNAGANDLTNVQVNWSVNGVTQTPLAYTNTLVPVTSSNGQNSDTVVLGNATLTAGANTIVVWTSLPNGVADINNTNDTVAETITAVTFAINPAQDTICGNGSAFLDLSPSSGYGASTSISWEWSDNGTTWNTIPNTNTTTYEATNIPATRQYRAHINNNGVSCFSGIATVVLDNIAITNTVADERCGPGTLTLNATPSSGIVNWYDVATGGTALHTGTSFTTPSINTTTTYYVEASSGTGGGIVNVGPLSPSTLGAGGYTNLYTYKTFFTVLSNTTLNSVDIFPQTVGSSGSIEILSEPGLTVVSTTPFTTTSGGSLVNGQTITLNTPLPPGNYSIKFAAGTNGNYYRNTAGANFPYTSPVANITGQNFSGYPQYYYYTYNFSFGSPACASPRVPVVATILDEPQVNLGNDTLICPSTSTVLDAGAATPGLNYLWNTGATTQTINVSTAGNYSVAVSNADCTKNDTVNIGIAPLPVAVLSDTVRICDGDVATLNAGNAGASYDWSNNSTTQTIGVTAGGLYTVEITNSDQCSIQDSSFVAINPLPTVDLGNDTMVCAGTPLVLNAQNPGATYVWNTGDLTQILNITQGGTYSVMVTDANNCSASDQITIEEFTPASVDGFTFVPKFEVQQGMVDFFPINPVFADSFHWDFGDGNTSDLETPTHIYAANGNYLVTLTIINECGSMDTALLINVDLFVGVRNVGKADIRVNVYPVPSSDILNIEVADGSTKIRSLKIVNAIGQEVFQSKNINRKDTKVELNNFAEGNYFIYIETENGDAFRKFSILR